MSTIAVSPLVDALTRGGIVQASDVAAIAQQVGLEVAAAATLLLMESHGGEMLWGHDPVPNGGIYTYGGFVTQVNYLQYKARRSELGAQGVGPCQLTSPDLQDAADQRGGCWSHAGNCTVGFGHLAALIKAYGVREGFRAYNGSGPAAEHYADIAMTLLTTWRKTLAALEDDVPLTDADAQKVAQAVLAALVPDFAKDPTGKTPIALGISEAWEAAHVGQVMSDIAAIKKKLGA